MPIKIAIKHVTHYTYGHPVSLGPQIIRLRPAPHCRSRIISYTLTVEPASHLMHWQQDPFANYQARCVFPEKTTEFKVTVDLVAEMSAYNPFDFFLDAIAEQFPFQYDALTKQDLAPYLQVDALTDATPLMKAYLAKVNTQIQPTIAFLVGLNQLVQQDIKYLSRMESGIQSPEQTLALQQGSCRDSAWLLVQLLRHYGLAARFVSGYLVQLIPEIKNPNDPNSVSIDSVDLHAWYEVYLPGAGWIGLDATSGMMAGEGHIPLACTPRPAIAAPVSGTIETNDVSMVHTMQVVRC